MVATSTEFRLEDTARDLLEVVTQLSLTALRGKRRSGDLKEVEFLTLSILAQQKTMIVGDIQRSLLPVNLPTIPTLDLAAYYQPSQRAGGDYYDFFPLPGGGPTRPSCGCRFPRLGRGIVSSSSPKLLMGQ